MMNSSLNPEQKTILWAIRVDRNKDSQIIELFKQEIKWDSVAMLAIEQGVLPLLYYRLKMLESDITPLHVIDELKGMFIANARRNLILSKSLSECILLLESHGITTISHKGPGLSMDAYEDLSIRQISDLDILIHRYDINLTKTILGESGFNPSTLFKIHEKMMQLSDKSSVFSRFNIAYEIHWDLLHWSHAINLNVNRLWKGFRFVEINGAKIRVLPLEDEVLILCIHGIFHQWEKLKWLADIVHLVHRHPELNWQDLLEYSKRTGTSRILLSTLQLAIDLGGLDLPQQIRENIIKDRASIKIAKQIENQIFNEGERSKILSDFCLLFRMRERSRDRMLQLLSSGIFIFLIPNESDFEMVDLPDSLNWLYLVIHPLRVIFITIPRRLAGIIKG